MSQQSEESIEKNSRWFANNSQYLKNIEQIDTYVRIRDAVNCELANAGKLLDVGSGGIFNYDITLPREIVALDLFLEQIDQTRLPGHIRFIQGSALKMPFANGEFDTLMMEMLIHHLTGSSPDESLANLETCLNECARVLKPGGKLVIVESCVPKWFYLFEKKVFSLGSATLGKMISHPLTLQYTAKILLQKITSRFHGVTGKELPKGKYILQFGVKVPSRLTPAQPWLFVGSKI